MKTELDAAEYGQRAQKLDGELTRHLRNRILRDDDNQRLLNGAGAQQDRGNLLRFLHQDAVEPTNNRAERELRPAAIARKLSHCSRNKRGARAFEAFTSVIQTLRKNDDINYRSRVRTTSRSRPIHLALSLYARLAFTATISLYQLRFRSSGALSLIS